MPREPSTSIDTLRNRARRGYDFIDQRLPGWDRTVTALSVGCPRRCALGQSLGHYERIARPLLEAEGYYQGELIALGFCLPQGEDYAPLDRAWNELLAARRGERYGASARAQERVLEDA